MKIRSRHLIVLMMFIILAACSPTNPTNDTTSILTQLPQPSSDLEDLETPPTAIARPSLTLLPSRTPNQTQTAMGQVIFSTQSAEQTLVAQYPRICEENYSPREYSPNGLWIAELCYSENDRSLILTLSQRETQVLWKLVYRDYIQNAEDLPDGGLAVVYWSNDGRYAYFNSFTSIDGGECFVGDGAENIGKGLFRLDLQTGIATTILPLRFGGYGFSFSPTGRRLVYDAYPLGANILDVKTGESIKIIPSSKFSFGGGYLWLPDGLEFVYSTVLYNEISEPVVYSFRLVDAQSGSERILLESRENCYAAREWKANQILVVESYDQNFHQTIIEYDLNLNKVTSEATATTFP